MVLWCHQFSAGSGPSYTPSANVSLTTTDYQNIVAAGYTVIRIPIDVQHILPGLPYPTSYLSPVSVAFGSYDPATGIVTLTTGQTTTLAPGASVQVSVKGTGSLVAAASGTFKAGTGTNGTTLIYTIVTGPSGTITGGSLPAIFQPLSTNYTKTPSGTYPGTGGCGGTYYSTTCTINYELVYLDSIVHTIVTLARVSGAPANIAIQLVPFVAGSLPTSGHLLAGYGSGSPTGNLQQDMFSGTGNQTNISTTSLADTLSHLASGLTGSASSSLTVATYYSTGAALHVWYKTDDAAGLSYTLAGGSSGAVPSASTQTQQPALGRTGGIAPLYINYPPAPSPGVPTNTNGGSFASTVDTGVTTCETFIPTPPSTSTTAVWPTNISTQLSGYNQKVACANSGGPSNPKNLYDFYDPTIEGAGTADALYDDPATGFNLATMWAAAGGHNMSNSPPAVLKIMIGVVGGQSYIPLTVWSFDGGKFGVRPYKTLPMSGVATGDGGTVYCLGTSGNLTNYDLDDWYIYAVTPPGPYTAPFCSISGNYATPGLWLSIEPSR